MNEEIIGRLTAVINTLNKVDVRGQQNYYNMYASISLLEDTKKVLSNCDIVVNAQEGDV